MNGPRRLMAALGLGLALVASTAAPVGAAPEAGSGSSKEQEKSQRGVKKASQGAAFESRPSRQVPATSKQTATIDSDRPSRSLAADPRAQQLIVKFRKDASASAQESTRTKYRLARKHVFKNGAELVAIPSDQQPDAYARTLAGERDVQYAVPNKVWKATGVSTMSPAPSPAPTAPTSDPQFGQLWGLENTGQAIAGSPGVVDIDMDAPEAWTTTMGDPGLVVGVIDTGIDFGHPDLADRAWTNLGEVAANGVDDDANGYVDDINGFDFYNNDGTVFDAAQGDQHGTHVAGTIAATNGNGVGITGVAPNVRIMSLKFLGPDGGFTSSAIQAIDYASARGVKITNNSWGGGGYDVALEDAIRYSGSLFVAAAGNDANDNDAFATYPAGYALSNVVSVAAVDNTGALAGFSNYGATTVDVGAPGVNVLSTVPRLPDSTHALEVNVPAAGSAAAYRAAVWGVGLEDLTGATSRADALGRTLSRLGATTASNILLVDDDQNSFYSNAESFYATALSNAGYTSVTTWPVAVGADGPSAADMAGKVVLWLSGDAFSSVANETQYVPNLSSNDQAALTSFLQSGGKLWLSGADILWQVETTPFVTQVLHTGWNGEGTALTLATGVAGSAYDGASYDFDGLDSGDGVANQYRDDLFPRTGAATRALVVAGAADYSTSYAYYNGTSMATPHVSGAAALVLSADPSKTPEQLRTAIESSVDRLSSLTGMTRTGGLVNASRALVADADGDIPGVAYPAASGTPVNGTVHVTEDRDDVYNVYLNRGESLRATLTGPADADFDLYAYAPYASTVQSSLDMLAASEGLTSSETLSFTATEHGSHFIDVSAYLGSGEYTLTLQWGNGPGLYEDSSPSIDFGPTWATSKTSSSHSGGTARFSDPLQRSGSSSAYSTMSFIGGGLKVRAYKGPDQGVMSVYLNGTTTDVSLYSASPQFNQVVFEKSGLSSSNSSWVQLSWTDRAAAGAKKSATQVNVDALEVLPGAALPPNDVTAIYGSGRVTLDWTANEVVDGYNVYRFVSGGATPAASTLTKLNSALITDTAFVDNTATAGPGGTEYGYTVRAVNAAGESFDSNYAYAFVPDTTPPPAPTGLTATVSGTTAKLTWTAVSASDLAGYDVYRSTTSGSGYAKINTGLVGSASFSDTGFSSGPKYYVVRAVDTSDNSSVNSNEATAGAATAVGAGLYQESDAAVVYAQSWTAQANSNDSGGGIRYSAAVGATASLTFNGTGVKWLSRKTPSSGIDEVYLDGVKVATVDRYSSSTLYQQVVFQQSGLASGTHTIKVVRTGTKNVSASNSNTMLDAFEVSVGVGAGLYQESDAAVVYGQSWTAQANSNDSGGGIRYTAVAGATASLTFNGTGVKWLSRKTPSSGIDEVYLDGVKVATVDRYSASTLYQQVVFQQSGLASGTHTIKVVRTGTKNASASNSNIVLDAFEIS